jgi:DNA-binding NarL/FixJ family response regulator
VGVDRYRVIVAEDDEAFAQAVEALLDGDGRFDVVAVARDGHTAVELAGRLDADVVVMDIEMPDCDGVEATRLLKAAQPDLPVVAISGHDYEERVFEIREAGAVDYVRKSRVPDDLISVLEASLVAALDRR